MCHVILTQVLQATRMYKGDTLPAHEWELTVNATDAKMLDGLMQLSTKKCALP